MEIVEKLWGYEKIVINRRDYCGKIFCIKKGWRCSYHQHKEKHETFYILSGKLLIRKNEDIKEYEKGESIEIKPYDKHCFTALEDSQIIEFSTHHDDDDVYRFDTSKQVF